VYRCNKIEIELNNIVNIELNNIVNIEWKLIFLKQLNSNKNQRKKDLQYFRVNIVQALQI